MTISVLCSCGKRLLAPDHLRGKKARCPGCGKALLVSPTPGSSPGNTPGNSALGGGLAASSSGGQESDLALDQSELAEAMASQEEPEEPPPGRACSSCGAPMRPADLVCPACGFSPQTGLFVRKKQEPREETRIYGTILGVDMTLKHWLAVGALFLLILSVVIWYNVLGPGRDFRVLETQLVASFDALDSITLDTPTGLAALGNIGARRMGPLAPGGMATASNGKAIAGDHYILGGGEKLTLLQPDPAGTFILVRAEMNQAFMVKSGQSGGYDMVFRSSAFTLQTPSGPLQGVLLISEFPSGTPLDAGGGRTFDYKVLFPSTCQPTRQKLAHANGAVASGELSFRGGGGQGQGDIRFQAPRVQSDFGASLIATGQLYLKSPQGLDVTYDYKGDQMTVNWSNADGWRATAGQYMLREHDWPYHKWPVVLLFPKPAKLGKCQLMCGTKVVATFYPPTTAKPPAAPPAPAPPAASPTSAPASPLTTLGDPLTDYLSALARARKKAQNIPVASHMQQLVIAIMLYAENNQGRMPDKLEDLRGTIESFDQLLINPRTHDRPGYIYIKPADKYDQIKDPSFTPMIYESLHGQQDPKGDIGYADGHITMGM